MNFINRFALGALGIMASLLLTSGCSSRNIHPELKQETGVLVRKWTLSSHGDFEAGDRGIGEYSNPILVDNLLVFGNHTTGLVALYPALNQQRWSLKIAGGVASPITVEKGNLYFGGGDGFLYSVALETGKVNWKYDVRNPFISQPTLNGGKIFVTTSDDTLYGFDAATGKWLWHYRRRSAQSSTILGASAPLVDGNEVIAGMSDGYLVVVSAMDGQLKWQKKLHDGNKFTDVDAQPVLENGILYVPSYDGALYALKRQNGETIWRFDAGASKRIYLEGDRIYLPSSDGYIYALQKSNAKVLWKFELDKGVPTQLLVTDKYVIAGSTHQYLYVLGKEEGKGIYRFNAGYESGFSAAPVYDAAGGKLYALSQAGNLYAFQMRKSSPRQYVRGKSDPYTF